MSDAFVYRPPQDPLSVLYRDRDVIVVNKPPGLLCVPGRLHKDSVLLRLKSEISPLYDVHRLDMDTSGIMIFALRRKAEKALKAAFRERRVHKCYIALVDGTPTLDRGFIDLPLRRLQGLPPRSVVDFSSGKEARTDYRVLEYRDGQTLLELIPKTGRSHQLRVHLFSKSMPIVGDRIYNPSSQAMRMMLHARSIRFPHPYSGQEVHVWVDCSF